MEQQRNSKSMDIVVEREAKNGPAAEREAAAAMHSGPDVLPADSTSKRSATLPGDSKRSDDAGDAMGSTRSYSLQWALKGHHKGAVSAVKFSRDGLMIASASADRTASIVDSGSGKVVKTLDGHEGGVSDVAWSADSSFLASASDDCTVRIWDVGTGKPTCSPLRGHLNYVFCVAFNNKGNLLASGSFDESVRLWDLRAGKSVRTMPAHSEPITSLSFNADGNVLATGSYDGLIRLWDVASGQCLTTLQLEERVTMPPVSCVRFTPNSRFILASSLDGRVRLWDYLLGKPLKTYKGHENLSVCCASTFLSSLSVATAGAASLPPAASKEEPSMAAGGEDGRVTVWNLQSKAVVCQWQAHDAGCSVLGIDAHPVAASTQLVTCGGGSSTSEGPVSDDFSIKMWRSD